MEKRPRRGLFVRALCSHVLSGLSPDSVDKPPAVMREPPPLAAAPATERSERVGEEAEFLRKSDLSTYAPGFLSAHVLTRPPGLSAGENAHGQAATAFASPLWFRAVLRFKVRLYAVTEFFRQFVQAFAQGGLFVGIQCVQFLEQRQALAFDESRHVERGLLLFVHVLPSPLLMLFG